jgi:hypothetical protein
VIFIKKYRSNNVFFYIFIFIFQKENVVIIELKLSIFFLIGKYYLNDLVLLLTLFLYYYFKEEAIKKVT